MEWNALAAKKVMQQQMALLRLPGRVIGSLCAVYVW